jgi:hypothetical protein
MWTLLMMAGAAAILACVVPAFKRAKAYPNRGSSIGALTDAERCLKEYFNRENRLPVASDGSTEALRRAGVYREYLPLLSYANDSAINSNSSPRTIVLVSRLPVRLASGSNGAYVGLFSGEIIAVPVESACLGSELPVGTGVVIDVR